MTDVAISGLPATTAPASTGVVPVVDASVTKKVTLADAVRAGSAAGTAFYYIDKGYVGGSSNGSLAKPYATITAALAARANGVFLIAPGDYSSESTLAIAASRKVQLIALSRAGSGSAYIANNVKIPGISQPTGGEQGELTLVGLECGGNWTLSVGARIIDCVEVGVESVSATDPYIEVSGGSFNGGVFGGGVFRGVTFASGVGLTVSAVALRLIACAFAGAAVSVTFSGAAGVVHYDEVSKNLFGGTPASVTNGVATLMTTGSGGGAGGGMSFPFTYSTTTTDADPGAGTFRGNNATLGNSTQLFFDDLESGGTTVSSWFATFDDAVSSGKGTVRLQSKSDPTKYLEFPITAYTSATGYSKITVTAPARGPGGILTTAGDTQVIFDAGATGTITTAAIADDAVTLDKLAQSACPQYRAVANAAARTGLPAGERNAGMLVRENDTGLLYVLAADLTTWVLADTSVTNQKISRASADAVGADMTLRKRRGTETSPAAVNAEDVLGSLSAQGHDGSGDYDAGRLRYVADAAGGTSKRSRVEQYLHDGTAFVKTEEAVTVRATTTDATLTVVRDIQLAADSVLRVRYGIVGAQNSSSNRAIRETSLTVRRSGSGDPVVVAYGDSIPLTKDDATWGTDTEIGHQVNTTTDALEIIVKGKAATTIVWRVDIVSSVR